MKWFLLLCLFGSTTLFASQKRIVIDLSEQKAYAYEDGVVRFSGRISSGKEGRETPTGEYRVLEKKRYHLSNLWPRPSGGAKMHYMLRLSYGGIAMHLGYVPNHPASHGCVRMKNGFAQRMFKWAEVGIPVTIEGDGAEYLARKHAKKHRTRAVYDDAYGVVEFHD